MKKKGIYRAACVLFTHRPVVVAYSNHTKPKSELPSGQFKRTDTKPKIELPSGQFKRAARARDAAHTRIECYSTAVAHY